VVIVGSEGTGEFGGGIIGVSDDRQGTVPLQPEQQGTQFIQQSAPITGAPDYPLVNAGGYWNGHTNSGYLDQKGHGLQGMAHDKGRFGVAAGLLVETFYSRHFATFLRALETIDQHDRPAIDPHQVAAEQTLEGLLPELGQAVEIQGRGVEKVKQAVIAGV
jgi:hypothetical protein